MTEVFTELISKLKDNLEKLKEKVFIQLNSQSLINIQDIESPREKVIVDVSTMDREFVAKNIRVRPQDLHVAPENFKSEGSQVNLDGDEQLGMGDGNFFKENFQ